jgi:hypothetical protein
MWCFDHFDFEACFVPHLNFQKSSGHVAVFENFDLEMCFAPHRRALFAHLNFQKSFEHLAVFENFDLEMCFVPQRRALFEHLNCQKSNGLCVLISKSRHNCVHFFDISTSKSGPEKYGAGVFCSFCLRN